MTSTVESTWVEHLSVDECWRLLTLCAVGRIGVLVDSAPEIYPVNHLVVNGAIVFRTDDGGKLRGMDRSPAVCYQADGFNFDDRTGWSVLVKGKAIPLPPGNELEVVSRLPWRIWTLGDKPHWIKIVPREITGRRIAHLDVRRRGTKDPAGTDVRP